MRDTSGILSIPRPPLSNFPREGITSRGGTGTGVSRRRVVPAPPVPPPPAFVMTLFDEYEGKVSGGDSSSGGGHGGFAPLSTRYRDAQKGGHWASGISFAHFQ